MDPDAAELEKWEQLRHDLQPFVERQPPVLMMFPELTPGYHRPPIELRLATSAEWLARDLHRRYGEFVELTLGALPYPIRPADGSPRRMGLRPANDLDIVLDGPLTIRTGESTRHAIVVTNRGDEDVEIRTNGHVTAVVVDDERVIVGGHSGIGIQPLVVFAARPNTPVRVPMLVGTDSVRPELGYAVPPGRWQLVAPLQLSDGREVTTPLLQFTVVS
jgi:hypothetical protein